MTILVFLVGAGGALGLILMVHGWTSPPAPVDPLRARQTRLVALSGLGAVVGAGLMFALTQWPALTVAGGLAGAAVPSFLERRRRGRLYVLARIEALASWIEQLRDRLSAGGGFQTTVGSTVRIAPEPIRADVTRLAHGLAEGSPEATEQALMTFATDVADPIADLVVVALWMWSQRRAKHLDELLTTLAKQARGEAARALEIDASRAGLRREKTILTFLLVGVPVALTAMDPSYLAPFGSTRGQVVLSGVLVMYASGLWFMSRLTRARRGPRVLASERVIGVSR
jgi:tight adherence protein B